ncbi:MAG TPA: ACT domain-containing protein [Clostridiales bacterium]|nr:ACT domain-containing protein [Clostridiales bacterium]
MHNKTTFYLVDASVLPEVFTSVVKAKRLLKLGKVNTVNEAVKAVGISRSAYYKYKEAVFPFTEGTRGKILTLALVLEDVPGVLSSILNIIAEARANILTMNQNIPVHGLANVTISIDTKELREDTDYLISMLGEQKGVQKIEILAKE